MIDQATPLFCLCSDIVEHYQIKDHPNCKMHTDEVITFTLLSALFFQGNFRKARQILQPFGFFPKFLSPSRLIRRIHAIPMDLWHACFALAKKLGSTQVVQGYIIDSFPVPSYQNHRSSRCNIFTHKQFHGYCASKKSYYFGLKVHLICGLDGSIQTFLLSEASLNDCKGMSRMDWSLPENAYVLADKAYTHYQFEDRLMRSKKVKLIAKRKSNARRQHCSEDIQKLKKRNFIESVFSSITHLMPRCIRAKTEKGFCLKVLFFLLAYAMKRLLPQSC